MTHHGIHLYPRLLVRQVTKFEVEGVERSIDIGDKLVPCVPAVVEPYGERAVSGLGRSATRDHPSKGCGSTFDRVDACRPEDLCMLERENAARKHGLEEEPLDVVGGHSHAGHIQQ